MVIRNIIIAHHRQLYTGEINLEDSASLIVLRYNSLQRHWEVLSAEYRSYVRTGSSWPPELDKLRKWLCMCLYLDGYQGVTQSSLNVQRCSEFVVEHGVAKVCGLRLTSLLHVHLTQPNWSSSSGKLHCFQSKGRSIQLDFIKSHSGDYLSFSKSKQKPLLSFDPFSQHPIMWLFSL